MIMKKKKTLFVILLIGFLVFGLVVASFACISTLYEVQSFSLEDYSNFLDAPTGYKETHLGKIDTPKEARKSAVKIFREVYAEYFLAQTPPYIVSYDSENDVWLVQAGKSFIPRWGAHIIINASDGEILGLWNYKF